MRKWNDYRIQHCFLERTHLVLYPSIMVKLLPYREIPKLTSRALVPDDQFNILSFFFFIKEQTTWRETWGQASQGEWIKYWEWSSQYKGIIIGLAARRSLISRPSSFNNKVVMGLFSLHSKQTQKMHPYILINPNPLLLKQVWKGFKQNISLKLFKLMQRASLGSNLLALLSNNCFHWNVMLDNFFLSKVISFTSFSYSFCLFNMIDKRTGREACGQ